VTCRPRAAVGVALLGGLFLFAFLGPYLGEWSHTDVDLGAFGEPPSADHWFGTTRSGKDVYALTMRGTQKSLIIGLAVALLSTGVAALAGTAAGYFGGWADRALMGLADLLLVLPMFLIVAIASPLLRGRAWLTLVVPLAALLWMVTARMVRGLTMSLREREYVLAARCMGASPVMIIVRHIVPNIASLLIVDAAMNVSAAVVAEAGLSYVGLGGRPPDNTRGTQIADGAGAGGGYPWMFCFAAGALVLIVLGVILVTDGLRDALDPKGHG
jgi:peptide/nickel transport system permease protein